jgi:hypothetical protein
VYHVEVVQPFLLAVMRRRVVEVEHPGVFKWVLNIEAVDAWIDIQGKHGNLALFEVKANNEIEPNLTAIMHIGLKCLNANSS